MTFRYHSTEVKVRVGVLQLSATRFFLLDTKMEVPREPGELAVLSLGSSQSGQRSRVRWVMGSLVRSLSCGGRADTAELVKTLLSTFPTDASLAC